MPVRLKFAGKSSAHVQEGLYLKLADFRDKSRECAWVWL
jgi:hypothetical protein